jgi:rare lipoprotein A
VKAGARLARPLVLVALVAMGMLAGCSSTPRVGDGTRDGPPTRPPADLHRVPDAVPRIEPLRAGGPNKPYEIGGRRYVPMTEDLPFRESGGASWYGVKFHGRPTSSGEPYDMYAMTAAHRTMPIPSYARVRNPANGREIVVRINDRGPFVDGRVIDLSYVAALRLGVLNGVAPVQVRRLTFADIRAIQALASAPAGDVEQRAGGVAGLGAEQPDDRLGDLVGRTGARDRDLGAQPGGAVGFAAAGVDLGFDDARTDRIDAHTFGGDLARQAEREGVDRRFRRRVVHILPR